MVGLQVTQVERIVLPQCSATQVGNSLVVAGNLFRVGSRCGSALLATGNVGFEDHYSHLAVPNLEGEA